MAPGASRGSEVRPGVLRLLTAACTGKLHLLKKLAKQLDDGGGMARTAAVCEDMRNRGAPHFAAMEGKIEVCKYLLEELELDVDPIDVDGQTPLFHVARSGHTETAKYLIEQGANPSMPEKAGLTAVHISAAIGAVELLNFLLSKGVHVDSQSNFGTPLIQAAGHAEQGAVNVLLEHHADPNAQNDDKLAPLSASIVAGSVECVKLLIQAGAKLNMSWAEGGTPLLVAAYFGKLEIISCLLEAGADADIADQYGMKPIEVAAQRGNGAAVEILFPKTSKIQTILEWSVDGILQYVPSETGFDPKIFNVNNAIWAENGEVGEAEESSNKKDALLTKQKLSKESREAKQKAAEAKLRGDDPYRRKDFQAALDAYTRIRLGEVEHALVDARACRALKPDWPKAWYREGAALRLLQRFEEAANSFYEAVKLDPENEELVNSFREAFEAARKFRGKDQISSTLNMMKTGELDA